MVSTAFFTSALSTAQRCGTNSFATLAEGGAVARNTFCAASRSNACMRGKEGTGQRAEAGNKKKHGNSRP